MFTSAPIVACLALALAAAAPATAAPTPNFTVPTTVVAGQTATFTSEPAPGEQITTTEWDFDNDGVFEQSGASAPHVFSAPGTYPVSLRVADGTESATLTRQVVVVAPPTAGFTPPAQALAGFPATFTSTSTPGPGADITDISWDFQDDGSVDAHGTVVDHTYPAPGSYTARVTVTDSSGLTATTTHAVDVVAPPKPVAGFAMTPDVPLVGVPATFTSTSSGLAGATIASVDWDFDNDNTIDAAGPVVTHPFDRAGTFFVRVHVVDSRGVSADFVGPITVNTPPVAAFTVFPAAPTAGDEVHLTSYSTDAEGGTLTQQWDLDEDGLYNDANGAVVTGMFTTAGNHTVSLRVRDGNDAAAFFSRTITVLPAKKGEAPPLPKKDTPASSDDVPPFVALVSPFPIVRLVGAVVKNGARIRMLAVRAPSGSKVYVKCRGKGCPSRRLMKAVRRKPVRFRSFERYLPAGSVLEILVRRGDQIGKYTSFLIRRNRVPKRSDGCLPPYMSRATKCPDD